MTYAARGRCGGPLGDALLARYPVQDVPDPDGAYRLGAWRRDDGLVVIGSDCAHPKVKGGVFESCPVALAKNFVVGDVWRAYGAYNSGQLALVYPEPSAQLLEAIEVLMHEKARRAEVEREERDRS